MAFYVQRNITTLKNISFVVSGKEKKQGPRVQVFFLTFVLDGVVLRFRLIGAETTPLLVCLCAYVFVCVRVWIMPVSPSPVLSQVHGSALELLSQADPWECREFLPDAPGHSAPAAPTHTHRYTHIHMHTHTHAHTYISSASPLTPTPLTDTAQRADTWLCAHTYTHVHTRTNTHTHTLGNFRESRGSAETL